MPVVAVFEFPGEDLAKYHKVFEIGGAPILDQPDRLSHICYQTAGGFTVVDVWADEASFEQFGDVIGPAAVQAGLEPKPLVYSAVAAISQAGTLTVW